MNRIHPTAIIDESVKMGDKNFVGPHVTIQGDVVIGNGNKFQAYCSVGSPAEKNGYFDVYGPVEIGDDNIFREFITINGGSTGITKIKDRVLMLRGSHCSHDTQLEEDVVVSCGAKIGGESRIMRGANLALGSILHQRSLVGSWSMVGMGAVVTKNSSIVPGNKYVGIPAKFLSKNNTGLMRARVTDEQLLEEIERFRALHDLMFDAHHR